MVIKGLETFRNHFKNYNDSYVILGGTACNEWFFEADLEFRLTKDVDMVLLLEAMEETFFQHFWDYLKAGGYSRWERADGYKTVFRFVEPSSEDYPYMIELLAHPQDVKVPQDQKIVRLKPGEGLSSLSAILLDGAYYQLLLKHRKVSASGLPLVLPEMLLLLKAKAYLNLLEDKKNGKAIKGRDLKKHRNDVFRLVYLLPAAFEMEMPDSVANDLRNFLEVFTPESDQWKGISQALRESRLEVRQSEELLSVIKSAYNL